MKPRPAEPGPLQVTVHDGQVDKAIKKFIKAFRNEGVGVDYGLHRSFRTKRQLRELKRRRSIRRAKNKERE